MITTLNLDLANEYKHMHFYLHSAAMVSGLHRQEYRELLLDEARSEMEHVTAFADLILGLANRHRLTVKLTVTPNPFPQHLTKVKDIVAYALEMEDEVVNNYVQRMTEAAQLADTADAKWIEVFMEDQILKSRSDADNLRQILIEIH